MANTAAQVIAKAQRTFPELDDTVALEHLNDEWAHLAVRYNLLDGETWHALTEDDREILLAETVARVQKAHLYTGADVSSPLRYLPESENDTYNSNWRVADSGTPKTYFLGAESSGNTGIRSFGLDPKPNTSTITVTDATNATPIVITTGSAHGLADGDQVRPINVGGNTAANVLAYAKVTGYSTTTFAMYSDEDLTTAIAGNSAYTSGGHIVAADSPAVRLFAQRSTTLITSDNVPNIGANSDIWVFGICWRYAREIRDYELMSREKSLYDYAVSQFESNLAQQAEGRGALILPYHYRPRRVV
jgi:hypothetical protein